MSVPCLVRTLAEGHTLGPSMEGGLGHEPMVDPSGAVTLVMITAIRPGLTSTITISLEGAPHTCTICRYCHALVLIPESEMPR